LSAVEGPGISAVIEPEAAIIIARDQVGRVGGVDGEHLLGLEAKRTVLIHADVAITAGRQHILTALCEEARERRGRLGLKGMSHGGGPPVEFPGGLQHGTQWA
jgi:hypothetical protein